ncbi:hypothetical protein RND81_07G154000 [Saponaria officinalis]|uniref:Uncharacterized protein n=1 Tax=Saponaria officinalis TaxID=3572 RepID=A0AAW1JR97_SAPOF
MPGRPSAKKRRAEPEENEERKFVKKRNTLTKCGNYGQMGHNRKGCKNQTVVPPKRTQKRSRTVSTQDEINLTQGHPQPAPTSSQPEDNPPPKSTPTSSQPENNPPPKSTPTSSQPQPNPPPKLAPTSLQPQPNPPPKSAPTSSQPQATPHLLLTAFPWLEYDL